MSDILVRCKVIAFFVTEANDPSVRPQTDVFKEYIEEAPCSKHHWGGIIGEASWGRHLDALGSIWKHLDASLEDIWEASGRQLGGIWETSGRHLGGIWEASGSIWEASGGIWEVSGRHLGGMGSQGVPKVV